VNVVDGMIEEPSGFVCRLCKRSVATRLGLSMHFSVKHKEIYDSGMTVMNSLFPFKVD
jgi:hypothetical protein